MGGQDMISAFYDWCHQLFKMLFDDYFKEAWVVWVGLFFVLQWHVRVAFFDTKLLHKINQTIGRPRRNLRRLGLHICVLQIYFSPHMPDIIRNHTFASAMGLLFTDMIFLRALIDSLAWKLVAKWHKDESLAAMTVAHQQGKLQEMFEDPRWDDDPDTDGGADAQTESFYMDLTKPLHRVLPYFVIQLLLLSFYISELHADDAEIKTENESTEFGYWIVGVMIQLFAGDFQFGSPYNRAFWNKVLTDDRTQDIRYEMYYLLDRIPISYGTGWLLRSYMDWIVNHVAKHIIMFTFPIFLSNEGPLDFVKDCTAIFFLTSLDDIGFENAKSLDVMLGRIKFNIFYSKVKASKGQDLDIPVKFTKAEADAAEFDPMAWDQFENQRDFESPFWPGTKLLDHLRLNYEGAESADDLFERTDTNKDGVIDVAELRAAADDGQEEITKIIDGQQQLIAKLQAELMEIKARLEKK